MKAILTLFVLPFFLAAFVCPATSALALEVITVKSEGTAIKTGGEAEAKRKANEAAFRTAVLDALSALMREENITADPAGLSSFIESEVSPSPLKYIINFRLLSEAWTVKEIPLESLQEAISQTGGVKRPEGAAPSTPPPPPPTVEGAETPSGAEPPVRVDVYNVWIEARIDAALLKSKLAKFAELKEMTPLKDVSIIILDVTDYDAFRKLYSSLGRITMLKDLSYSSFYRGRIVVKARTLAKEADIAERIRREAGNEFVAFTVSEGTIVIKPAPKRPM